MLLPKHFYATSLLISLFFILIGFGAKSQTLKGKVVDVNTGEPVLLNETCNITTRTKLYNQTTDEYYIVYRFTEEQTSEVGKFEGKVNVSFDNGNKLILPVKEKLYINIF